MQYNGIGGSLGASIFKGKPYLMIGVSPQFEFGDWGLGIDGAIRVSNKGELRKEDFDQLYDAVRWVNYIRFNKPKDDFYFRVGGLVHSTLGNGSIVDNYTNNSSYDDRRVGAAARLDLGFLGAEALVGDAFHWQIDKGKIDVPVPSSLVAARVFTRPFQLTPLTNMWFFHNLEFGGTATNDYDSNAVRIIPNHPPYVLHYTDTVDGKVHDSLVVVKDSARLASPLKMYGLDANIMVWKDNDNEGRLYGDWVKISGFNEGFIIGARASFHSDSNTFWDLRLERHLFKNYFLPNYYNSFYERERYNDDVTSLDYITKATRLADTVSGQGNGSKFGIFASLNGLLDVTLNYAHLDNLPRSDLLEINIRFPNIWWKFYGAISYQRSAIDGPADYFKFDEHTIAGARLSVAPVPFLVLSLVARWTFTRDLYNHVATQGIIEPKATFIARF
jgi:hypothetical protein